MPVRFVGDIERSVSSGQAPARRGASNLLAAKNTHMTTLRHKFIFIVGGVTLLAMLVGASALVFITHVDTATDSALPRTYRVIEATAAAGDAARMLDAAARTLIQSVDPEAAREIDHYDTIFRISLHRAKNEIPRPFTRKEALHARRLAEQYTIYIALLRDMADPATNHNTRLALYEQRAAPLYRLIASDTDRLKSLAGERINQLLEDAQEASRRTLRRVTLLLFCSAAVCLLSVFFFDRSVLRPVRRIRKLALEIKDGNLEVRADIKPAGKRRDEIAQLAEAFNEMAHARSLAEAELTRAAEALRASDSLNRTIIASTSDMVVALDTNSRIILQNEAFVREAAALAGITPEVGQHLPSLLAKHPQARTWAEAMWSRALAGEHFRITQVIRVHDAEPRCYDFHFDALYDEQGAIIGALQTGRDVTEHHRMERELREAATDLRSGPGPSDQFSANIRWTQFLVTPPCAPKPEGAPPLAGSPGIPPSACALQGQHGAAGCCRTQTTLPVRAAGRCPSQYPANTRIRI